MNMSYCRFENTVNDMIDCINNMEIDKYASEEVIGNIYEHPHILGEE